MDISSATAPVALDLIKDLAVLSDTTVRRSAVDREGLKAHWNSEKKATFLQAINNSITHKFFKDLTIHRKKTNRVVAFRQAIKNCYAGLLILHLVLLLNSWLVAEMQPV